MLFSNNSSFRSFFLTCDSFCRVGNIFVYFVLISERPLQKIFVSSNRSGDTFVPFHKFSTYASIKLAPIKDRERFWNESKNIGYV